MKYRLPSMGFVWLCATAAFAAVFFAWGISEPGLDRAWELVHELKIGRVQRLEPGDLELLRDTFERFPDLGPAILEGSDLRLLSANHEGWVETEAAYMLVARGKAGLGAKFRWRPQKPGPAAKVVLAGRDGAIEVEVGAGGEVSVRIPEDLLPSGILEIRPAAGSGPAEGISGGLQVVLDSGG